MVLYLLHITILVLSVHSLTYISPTTAVSESMNIDHADVTMHCETQRVGKVHL